MKIILLNLIFLALIIAGCKKDSSDESYIKTNKVYEPGDGKLYADITHSGLPCAKNPESGVCWSYAPSPTIIDNKVVSITECYTHTSGNIIISNPKPTN